MQWLPFIQNTSWRPANIMYRDCVKEISNRASKLRKWVNRKIGETFLKGNAGKLWSEFTLTPGVLHIWSATLHSWSSCCAVLLAGVNRLYNSILWVYSGNSHQYEGCLFFQGSSGKSNMTQGNLKEGLVQNCQLRLQRKSSNQDTQTSQNTFWVRPWVCRHVLTSFIITIQFQGIFCIVCIKVSDRGLHGVLVLPRATFWSDRLCLQ